MGDPMANLSVCGLDDKDLLALKKQAAQLSSSVNSVVLQFIARGLGRQASKRKRYDDLDAMVGRWQKKEAPQFERATAQFSQIEPELWTKQSA
jgi:hypothetical protein